MRLVIKKLIFRVTAWFLYLILLMLLLAIMIPGILVFLFMGFRTWAVLGLRDWAHDLDYYGKYPEWLLFGDYP
jgi:hypothetical protein